jgi:hypothetical protein
MVNDRAATDNASHIRYAAELVALASGLLARSAGPSAGSMPLLITPNHTPARDGANPRQPLSVNELFLLYY